MTIERLDYLYIGGSDFDEEGVRPPAKPREFWFAAIACLAISGFFLLWAAFEQARIIEHEKYAVETTGMITRVWSHRSPRRGRVWSHRYHTSHYMNVAFGEFESEQYSYRQNLSALEWDKYNVGDKVAVWYVPSNPVNHSVGVKGYQSAHTLYIFAAIVMLAISAAFWFEYLATRPRIRRVLTA